MNAFLNSQFISMYPLFRYVTAAQIIGKYTGFTRYDMYYLQ